VLQGAQSNRDGIGARVRARIGATWQTRMVRTGSSYLSQSELPLTIGLGGAAAIDETIVEWPGGTRDRLGPLREGRVYRIAEGGKVSVDRPLTTTEKSRQR
jgi:hypothetical protein